MKSLWILLLATLAGCHSAPTPPERRAPDTVVVPPATPPPREAELEARLQQQRYVIDALLSQQEAWQAQATPTRQPEDRKPMRFLPRKAEVPAQPASERVPPFLVPDAGGIIDLTALGKKPADESTNPFVVAPPASPAREVLLSVQGVLPGPNPSAIVNDRPLEIAESVDSLRLARVETDAAIFAFGDQHLRIPLGRPVRVRLP
jgi:hypothetical protein